LPWAVYGDKESRTNLINSILMNTQILSDLNWKLQDKYVRLKSEIVDFEEFSADDAEILFVAYGISSRICQTSLQSLRKRGIKAGLLRPKTLFPFPSERIYSLASKAKFIVAVELSDGQMAEDVELAVRCTCPVLRYNWLGGIVPSSEEIVERVEKDISQV
ncbi:MAG: 3-methyl-2-oxobutanoate dehydrogenase subunit beta, partial [Spirochaetales bacterium]